MTPCPSRRLLVEQKRYPTRGDPRNARLENANPLQPHGNVAVEIAHLSPQRCLDHLSDRYAGEAPASEIRRYPAEELRVCLRPALRLERAWHGEATSR